jgi:hypothetical protein
LTCGIAVISGDELGDIVAVATGQAGHKWDAMSFGEYVVFAAGLGAIYRGAGLGAAIQPVGVRRVPTEVAQVKHYGRGD